MAVLLPSAPTGPARPAEPAEPARPAHPSGRPPAAAGPNRRLGVAAIVVSAAAMGTAGLFGRMATPPGAVVGEALTLGRMLAGALAMLVVLAVTRRLGRLRRTRVTPSVVLGGVLLGLSLATYLSATVLVDLTLAVVLHYLGPVVATVLAATLRRERVGAADVVSLSTAFAGMLLAAGLVGATPTASSPEQVTGVVLAAVSGLLYGGALLCYRYRADVPSDVRSLWTFAFGAVATGATVAVTRPDLSGLTPTHWAWAGAFFLVCGVLALSLLVVAGKHLRAVELSSLSYVEVVVAVLVGAAAFGETVGPLAAAGVLLVVVAALVPLVPRVPRVPRVPDRVRAAVPRASATCAPGAPSPRLGCAPDGTRAR